MRSWSIKKNIGHRSQPSVAVSWHLLPCPLLYVQIRSSCHLSPLCLPHSSAVFSRPDTWKSPQKSWIFFVTFKSQGNLWGRQTQFLKNAGFWYSTVHPPAGEFQLPNTWNTKKMCFLLLLTFLFRSCSLSQHGWKPKRLPVNHWTSDFYL